MILGKLLPRDTADIFAGLPPSAKLVSMRVVIDTNCLESEELDLLLSSSKNHAAVIPGHTIAEIFRPRDNEAIFASLKIICTYSRQVIVLKENRLANRVDPKAPAISNHFIDKDTTRQFPKFCEVIEAAQQGDPAYLRQIERRRQWAIERVETAQAAMGDQSEALEELRANFADHELRELRAGRKLKDETRFKILALVTQPADKMFADQSNGTHIHSPPYRYNQFVWRYALAHIVQMMQLLRKGAVRRAPEKARNDHFDNVFATFGTYFNGVMSNDMGTLVTQDILRVILKSLGARLAPDYVTTGYIEQLIEQQAKK